MNNKNLQKVCVESQNIEDPAAQLEYSSPNDKNIPLAKEMALEDIKKKAIEENSKLMELEFTPNFTNLRKENSGVNLEFNDIRFSVGKREILKGISGEVKRNEVCALLGPSGAGKSSLLNILAGRIASSKKKKIEGNVKINGSIINPQEFRKNVSYVLQEDSLFATATAREAFEFSAALRLPRGTSKNDRKVIVDELLKSLGLSHVENTMCGSTMVRGLSGGEKKRVSIGVELVTNPQLLFLDEPTSGLDSYSAFQVISILKALSEAGCAVLCTIHQPSSEIFQRFDKCITLANGKIMYSGSVVKLPENLSSIGFTMPSLTNPADYVMLLAQTKSEEEMPQFIEDFGKFNKTTNNNESSTFNLPEEVAFVADKKVDKFTQLKYLSIREFKNLKRDKGALIGRFVITTLLNLLFGWIFFGAGNYNKPDYDFGAHFGALTNILISALFGAAQPPLLTFPLDRVVFLREYSTGSYSSIPYILSKLMVDIPLYFVVSVLIMVVMYWMIGFSGSFVLLVLVIFLVQIVSASYAYLIGALVSDVKAAQEFAPIVLVPQLLFLGFFININLIPESIRWVQYLCSLKYGMNLALLVEFGGNMCYQGVNETMKEIHLETCETNLDRNNTHSDMVWFYILILVAIFVVFRGGSLIALIFRARNFSS